MHACRRAGGDTRMHTHTYVHREVCYFLFTQFETAFPCSALWTSVSLGSILCGCCNTQVWFRAVCIHWSAMSIFFWLHVKLLQLRSLHTPYLHIWHKHMICVVGSVAELTSAQTGVPGSCVWTTGRPFAKQIIFCGGCVNCQCIKKVKATYWIYHVPSINQQPIKAGVAAMSWRGHTIN